VFCEWQGVCEPCTTDGNVHSGQTAHYLHIITHSGFPTPNASTTAIKEPVFLLPVVWVCCGLQGVCELCKTDKNMHSGQSANYLHTITHSGYQHPMVARLQSRNQCCWFQVCKYFVDGRVCVNLVQQMGMCSPVSLHTTCIPSLTQGTNTQW